MGDRKLINQAVIFSDTHCGSQFGLCPPFFTLDNGGTYKASPLQKKMWGFWVEFWDWVKGVTRGEPYVIVLNGDPIDGVHHKTNTLISSNYEDQIRIAQECIAPYIKDADAFYAVRGTEAHGGQSLQYEEMLAQRLGAVCDTAGRYTRYELILKLGEARVDIQHHISAVGSMAYETTALNKTFAAACLEAGRWKLPAPDIVVRSHRHRYSEVRLPVDGRDGICVTTPCWQLKTPYTYRMMGAQMSLPQFGGILVRSGDEENYVRNYVRTVKRAKAIVPVAKEG